MELLEDRTLLDVGLRCIEQFERWRSKLIDNYGPAIIVRELSGADLPLIQETLADSHLVDAFQDAFRLDIDVGLPTEAEVTNFLSEMGGRSIASI